MKIDKKIKYRKICTGEEDKVFGLVQAGFEEYVLSSLTEEGSREFFRAAREMIYGKPKGHVIMVAESTDGILGMLDIRNYDHICLFFVARDFQGRGIGRGLLDRATADCLENNAKRLDVNSSLFAAPIYEKLGFIQSKPEQLLNGIRFVPMVKTLKKEKG